MSTLATPFRALVVIYRLAVALWNACIVFLRVMQLVVREAKQEATELMALLDDNAPTMDEIISTSMLLDATGPANPWQMLIVARASSFVLLLRLSKLRVLHLEVDESFIIAKLEVIRTELILHIQHIPRLLQMPIGTHDTRLIRYTPMKLPFIWKEEQAGERYDDEAVERFVVPPSASSVNVGAEGRSRRKKYVQLLTESALRRRSHMDRVGLEAAPKRGMGIAKNQGENMIRRKALTNATNMGSTLPEWSANVDGTSEETNGFEPGVVGTPKQVRMERNIYTALSENLSILNMAQAVASRKVVESGQQPRRTGPQSLRRKRGQFDLYAQGLPSEFSLLQKMGQGRD